MGEEYVESSTSAERTPTKDMCIFFNLKTADCIKCTSGKSACFGFNKTCNDYFPYLKTSEQGFAGSYTEDQTIKADAGKAKLTLVPQQIIFDIARVREYGLKKYGESESWKKVDIQRYRDAAYRHFLAYLRDPHGVDEESGLPHLSHLACNIAFLSEMEKNDISNNTKGTDKQ